MTTSLLKDRLFHPMGGKVSNGQKTNNSTAQASREQRLRKSTTVPSRHNPALLVGGMLVKSMAPSQSRTGVAKIRDQQVEAYRRNRLPQTSCDVGLRKFSTVTNKLRPMGEINGPKQVANRSGENPPRRPTGCALCLCVKPMAPSTALTGVAKILHIDQQAEGDR